MCTQCDHNHIFKPVVVQDIFNHTLTNSTLWSFNYMWLINAIDLFDIYAHKKVHVFITQSYRANVPILPRNHH